MKKDGGILRALTSLIGISIVIVGVVIFLIKKEELVGIIFLGMGVILIGIIKLFGIKLKAIYPNLIFGFVDDGLLVITSTIGGMFAGISGAIIGGAAGNAITDGIGGIFEGKVAENLKKQKIKENRTPFATMIGKITGCLIGAGLFLTLIWIIKIII